MKRLSSFNLNLVKNKQWYHQRFDGCPMFIWFIADADFYPEKRRPRGTEPKVRICFFYQGSADWYMDMQDIRRGAKAITKLAKKDPQISKKLLAAWESDEKKFDKFFIEFEKINFKKISTKKVYELWNKFWLLSIKRLTSSTIIDHFALGTDEQIGRMLRQESRGAYKTESDFTRVFSLATAPVHQSFVNLAEIDLLKIILGKSKEKLEDYKKRYYWSKNNYFTAQSLSLKYFKEEILSWKKSGKDLNQELSRIENTPVRNRREKESLLSQFKLSPLLRTLLVISEDFTRWQDERKRATYLAIDMGSIILKELGRRIGYTPLELKYALPDELENIYKAGQPTPKELRNRSKKCLFIMNKEGFYVGVGKFQEKLIKEIVLGKKDLGDIQDFRGLSASTGRAIGRVKIVKSATEVGKVKPGDILVAVMTRPDYIIAMKKAAAIVTNEGGITSHAAIVSRELGIPCIIGTKIATEVLRDGDLVEVNANHGWVRKLNKK